MTQQRNRRIAILGAGPAGLSCALWCKRAGLEPILIDSTPTQGGAASHTHSPNHWHLGHPGASGQMLAIDWAEHTALEHIPFIGDSWVESITREGDTITLHISVTDKNSITLKVAALVIATGERAKGTEMFADIPGFESAYEAGRIQFGSVDADMLGSEHSGKQVVVIGGGDNAYDTARMLLPHVAKLTLIMRGQPRAQHYIRSDVEAWQQRGNLEIKHQHVLESFVYAHNQVTLNLLNAEGTLSSLTADAVFARLGYTPNSEQPVNLLVKLGELALHPTGHIITDADMRTTIERVYAAGDVTNPNHPCIPTAIAHGAVAARTLEKDLFQ